MSSSVDQPTSTGHSIFLPRPWSKSSAAVYGQAGAIVIDHSLRRLLGLAEEEPVPPRVCEACVCPPQVLSDRDAVQNRQRGHCVRVVERQSVRNGRAAIMADDAEAVV